MTSYINNLDREIIDATQYFQMEDLKVLENLKLKHPIADEPTAAALLQGPIESIHNVIYENINGVSIQKAAVNTKGAGGPSGLDSDGWGRILVSRIYGKIGEEMRNAVAHYKTIKTF